MDLFATEDQGIELLYRQVGLEHIAFHEDVVLQFNQVCNDLELQPISNGEHWGFDFFIPAEYKSIDVIDYVTKLCPNDANYRQRVELELEMYQQRKLEPMLQLMIYIVDCLKKSGAVWGVGRGSSVASYVLYLLGIHRIDSVKYELDIKEFLK